MPYVNQRDRISLITVSGKQPDTAGELNYVLTTICDKYLVEKGLNYQNINEVVGVLECCKLELYRRIAAPYENIKCEENGDVYESIIKNHP